MSCWLIDINCERLSMRPGNSTDKENKENQLQEEQSPRPYKRFSHLPKTSKYGRRITDSRKNDPRAALFEWPSHLPNRRGGFNLHFLLAKGDLIPVVEDDDELDIKRMLSKKVLGYYTPTKTKSYPSATGLPCLQTTTPGHRVFRRVARVTATRGDQESYIEFFQQPGNSRERFEKYPPVVNKSPRSVKRKLVPPKEDVKRVSRYVTESAIKKARTKPRRNPNRLFGYVSANEIKQAESPDQPLEGKFVLSHIDQVGSGAADVREQITVTDENHNTMRLFVVENPGRSVVSDPSIDGLRYSCKAPVLKDDEGRATHIAGATETSSWKDRSEEKASIEVVLYPQNPERPTKALHSSMKLIFNTTFLPSSSDDSAVKDSENSSDDDDAFLLSKVPHF